ncbi:hypothetical protein BCR32DRAFT_239526 [Anaeromyces robustus]|uniref:Uncharacterized protein n=1 Tax=Anaeromyces robustus TaxID=1754192 RepID=A0A1Y1XR98_9FUNG|nr:hypothetical protein BCR32DRAFT_239526 [Anaeromyces robustus]|eukprot:ORX88257.1 hypothetical protein BCR32DRAFT_239526 [Anaeromyces robustus]
MLIKKIQQRKKVKKKTVKQKETPIWGDPDCKSFVYHPVTGKPLNPFPNLKEQESIIPFFSERVELKRHELDIKKKNEQEQNQAGSLYKPINISSFGSTKEEKPDSGDPKLKPKTIIDLHRFEWMKRESWIRCRLRQKSWSYNDMFLNVQCSWTLLRLKMEIKKHLFEGSLLSDNILIYKNDLSKIKLKSDLDDSDEDYSVSNNNQYTQELKSSKYTEPLYKLFPRIQQLKSIGTMIPFKEGYTKCDDNEYPILVVGQRPIQIYEPPPPPPPPPAKKKVVKKKKDDKDKTKKKSSLSKNGAKKKKVVKKKKSKIIEEDEIPPVEIDPNAPHEPNDSEILDFEDEKVQIYYEPDQILKNPDQYLYVYFDVNSPFVPS